MKQNLTDAVLSVFTTSDPKKKAEQALLVSQKWETKQLTRHTQPYTTWPNRPHRPQKPELLHPTMMPKRKLKGKKGRLHLLHALAHIELNAIDLAFDLIGRFGHVNFPDNFIDDWIKVGADEAKHFLLLRERLQSLGSDYGDFPAHDGLWEAALDTKDSLSARLAIVPLVLEARGLDVTPHMIEKLTNAQDLESAKILHIIYEDEKTHVRIGSHWFMELCKKENKTL